MSDRRTYLLHCLSCMKQCSRMLDHLDACPPAVMTKSYMQEESRQLGRQVAYQVRIVVQRNTERWCRAALTHGRAFCRA